MSSREAAMEQPGLTIAIDLPVDLLETIIRDRWQHLAARYPVIYLFGAGQHTRWLLGVVAATPGPEIAAILDDSASTGMTLGGYPVMLPSSTSADAVDAVIVSTDNPSSSLMQRCAMWMKTGKPITLYDGMPAGPYRKERRPATISQTDPVAAITPPPEIHQLRLRLPARMQQLFGMLLPFIHPPLSKALRALYGDVDAVADAFTRNSTICGMQYVRDVFYPPSRRFVRIADLAGIGIRLKLNLCEVESGNLFFGRDFEQIELDSVRAILRPGDCVIDGGAHMGLFSLAAARQVGESGSVHAFEANPEVYAALLDNLKLNHAGNVTPNPRALAERPGEVTLCINEDTTLSSLAETGRGRVVRRLAILATSLDEYARIAPLTNVRLLKLDLEGLEWDVLRGATSLMAQNPEMAILCELALRNIIPRNIRTADVVAWVRRQGLYVWEIDVARRRLIRLEGDEPRCGYRNYYFARQASRMAGLLDAMTEAIPEGGKQ